MKQSIYLDTSVVSACFDDRIPYQRDVTKRWWSKAQEQYDICLSAVTLDELAAAEESKRKSFLSLVENVPVLSVSEDVVDLAQRYVDAAIVPARYGADALHVACATIYKVDYLVTWNCSHLANVNKIRAISLFNTSAGMFVPAIVTPEFFVFSEESQ